MKKIVLVVLLGSVMGMMGGCDKASNVASQVVGGPADGHDVPWYRSHPVEAKAEQTYCQDKYAGPNSTKADLEAAPDYCKLVMDMGHLSGEYLKK